MGDFESEVSAGELINQAVVAARRQQPVQAIELLSRAISDSQAPSALVGKALLNRGVIYAALELRDKALADFDAALGLAQLGEPERGRVHLERAIALSKSGHHDLAISELLDQMSQTAVSAKRQDAVARALNQARRRRDVQDKELARLAGQVQSAVLTKPKREQAQFDRALLLSERGDWAGALDEYDQLLQKEGLNCTLKGLVFCNRGVIRASRGRLQEAQQDYLSALALEQAGTQAHGHAHNNLGLLHLKEGRAQEAIAAFSKGLELPSISGDVMPLLLFNRAAANGQAGLTQNQKNDLDVLLDLSDLSAAWRAKAYNQRGMWYLTHGELYGAQLDFQQVVNDSSTQGDLAALAYNNLGVVSGQRNESEQALDYFSKALTVPGASGAALSNAHFNRGAALAQLGKVQDALQSYEAAVSQPDGDREVFAMSLTNRAMLLIELGQDALAWKDLSVLLAQADAPTFQQAKAYALQARIAYKRGQWDEVLRTAQAGLTKIDSAELTLLSVLAHLWRSEGSAARTKIESLRAVPGAEPVLQQFRQDLLQTVHEGMPQAHADLVLDLLPALSRQQMAA